MSEGPKRFFKAVRTAEVENGYGIELDTRPVRTPASRPLVLPSAALAAAVAEEWDAQKEHIRPETMPMTRLANAAIDRVAPDPAPHIEAAAAVGTTDLLCYRADAPEALAARQDAQWQPLLDWAEETYGAPLAVTRGIVAVDQPPESLAKLKSALEREAGDPFALTSLLAFVPLLGSLVLGLALFHGRLDAQGAWDAATLDEIWQREQWGEDTEALARDARLFAELAEANAFLKALGRGGR
jgi:chaperone required for assembly of F1-ATPase